MLNRKRRTILRFVAGLFLILAALLLTLPVWLPWFLRIAAKPLNLGYTDYEREGYSRFALKAVRIQTGSSLIQAARVEAFIPTVWLWRAVTGQTNQAFLEAQSWSFESLATSGGTDQSASVFTNVTELRRTFSMLRTWAPHLYLTNGTVVLSETLTIALPRLLWLGGSLDAATAADPVGTVALGLDTAVHPMQLRAVAAKLNTDLAMDLRLTSSNLAVQGNVLWLSNRIDLGAEFQRAGNLPQQVSVRAERFSIPATILRLRHYQKVQGSIAAEWNLSGGGSSETGHQFTIDVAADAVPLSDELPPVELQLQASGTTNAARINTARLVLPWMTAELSGGTAVQFREPYLHDPSALSVVVDLSKQARFPGAGILEGRAVMFPSTNRAPRVAFQLAGEHLAVSNLNIRAVRLDGDFDWPLVMLRGTRVTLEDGSEAQLSGAVNVESNLVESGEVVISGAFGRELLPAGYAFGSAEARAQVKGPFSGLNHFGEIRFADLRIPKGKPMQFAVQWRGTGAEVESVQAQAVSGQAQAAMNAAGRFTHTNVNIELRELLFTSSRHGELHLERPVTFHYEARRVGAVTNRVLNCSPLRLAGEDRTFELSGGMNWPSEGSLRLFVENIGSDLLDDFIAFTNGAVHVSRLDLRGSWTNSPVTFTNDMVVRLQWPQQPEVELRAAVGGSGEGVTISDATISTVTQVVCHANGFVPIAVEPSSSNAWIQFRDHGELRLNAFTETNSALWERFAAQLPIKLQNPNVRVDVSGTWRKPTGVVKAEIERVQIVSKKPVPEIRRLNFGMEMDRENAAARFSALVQEQPVHAEATMPLGQGFWKAVLQERRAPDLKSARGEFVMSNAKVGPFAEFAPELIAPQGEISLNIHLSPNLQFTGEALIYNLATRPIATLGPVRSIDGRILFSGSRLALTNFVAEIGGQRVRAHGSARVDEGMLKDRRLPAFDLQVSGTNVPLVRQANVLIRSDLNLAITNVAGSNGVVAGAVRLREGFFLSSLKDLAPGKVATPKRRPPYFSIEIEPFAAWRLAVNVEGDRFLKAQSPFFRGTISTTLRVEGTLKEPRALGEARINSGTITFPFGSLDVRQGFVSLTSANPYQPQLFVTAEAERMGYDIRMEASGPADEPVVQFSSSPPLSSEQIVLMLTTGQTPAGVATSMSTRQRAQGMALFVGKNILSELGIGGGDGRLTIRSGEQVTETGRPTYDVEYKLDEDWSAVGEYDRFSQYNLGFKWRIYSK